MGKNMWFELKTHIPIVVTVGPKYEIAPYLDGVCLSQRSLYKTFIRETRI